MSNKINGLPGKSTARRIVLRMGLDWSSVVGIPIPDIAIRQHPALILPVKPSVSGVLLIPFGGGGSRELPVFLLLNSHRLILLDSCN
jgi:hypothetical protein